MPESQKAILEVAMGSHMFLGYHKLASRLGLLDSSNMLALQQFTGSPGACSLYLMHQLAIHMTGFAHKRAKEHHLAYCPRR